MKKLTLLLLFVFHISTIVNAQNTKHISTILMTYQFSLTKIETKLNFITSDSLYKISNLNDFIITLKELQVQKFNLDSAFIEYEFMSKRILLDKILTKRKLKKKRRKKLQEELLKWNYHSCHPKSDQLWHSVSRFFYNIETITNNPYPERSNFHFLADEIKNQQRIITIILQDITP